MFVCERWGTDVGVCASDDDQFAIIFSFHLYLHVPFDFSTVILFEYLAVSEKQSTDVETQRH